MKWLCFIVLPCITLCMLQAILVLPALAAWRFDGTFWTLLAFSVALYFCGLLLYRLFAQHADDRIGITQSGLSVPCHARSGRLYFSIHHEWSEVTSASLVPGTSPKENDRQLLLTLLSDKPIKLSLNGFTPSDLEQLLLAIELWGLNTKRSPELIDYQVQLQNENKGVERIGYTRIWEEELTRRFSTSAFVPLEPGSKLRDGSLEITKQLAFGGLSAIYLAQTNDGETAVVKEASVPRSTNESMRRQAEKHLVREFELLSKLRHPNLAKVLDYFVEDGKNYLLLEYIPGQDLRQLVREKGPQPVGRISDWAVQMAEALSFLHGRNPQIIHRDFTPDNLVLKNDGTLVLIDFGASNEFIGTATGTLVGKQAYIAPEQLRGKAVCKSDIYAFGATLFFLITGRDPMALSQSRPTAVLPDVPAKLDDLVACCTSVIEEERYNASEIKELLLKLSAA
jgi:tRNA A-37 threonylcarbamoyl transferase component Bud32